MSIVFNGHTVAGAPPPSDTANAAKKADLTSIIATGATNATGATITSGTFFYLNGTLVQALADIASGATFTENTNYEVPSAGSLNALKSAIAEQLCLDNQSVTDANTASRRFMFYNGTTLHTPYTEGLTQGTEGIILTVAIKNDNTWNTQIAIANAGTAMYIRTAQGNGWNAWQTFLVV